jgi:putative flavoprotein involved in K+ transport
VEQLQSAREKCEVHPTISGARGDDSTTVIWASGYKFDSSMIHLPVRDADGYPIQTRGITEYPGLYLLGLPWLHSRKSGLLYGGGEDAHVVSHLLLQ